MRDSAEVPGVATAPPVANANAHYDLQTSKLSAVFFVGTVHGALKGVRVTRDVSDAGKVEV